MVVWAKWLERNVSVFGDKEEDFEGLRDMICYLNSFWVLVSLPLKEFQFV